MFKGLNKTQGTKILSRDDILKANDIRIELVETPEWGGAVYVRGLDGAEVGKFTKSITDQRKGKQTVNLADIREKLCALSMCDESGKRLFSDVDVAALSRKASAPLIRVFKKAQELSGLGDEDVKELADDLREDPLEDSASD